MGIKTYRPVTPSLRATTSLTNEEIIQYFKMLNKQEIAVLVKQEYEQVKDANSWLWVKNVWRADTVVSVIPSYDEYVSAAGIKYDKKAEKNNPQKIFLKKQKHNECMYWIFKRLKAILDI